MEEILKEVILAEKDSIVFYLGMKEMVSENFGKSKTDAIYQGRDGTYQAFKCQAGCSKKIAGALLLIF